MGRRLLVDSLRIALVAVAYFLAARAGLKVAFVAAQVSAVWPATGVALVAVRFAGYRVWPGIAIGAFVANVMTFEPVLTAGGIACGNTLEALVAAWLLERVIGFDHALERFKDAIGLVVMGAIFSTALAATVGALSLCLGGVQPWDKFGSLWSVWWLGDAMGDLTLAPFVLVWSSTWRRPWSGRQLGEAAALVVALGLVCWFAFGSRIPNVDTQYAYGLFPVMIWAALRFGQQGATAATMLISTVAIEATLARFGPFARASDNESLNLLQMFMGMLSTTGLLLAAAATERSRVQQLLEASDRRKDEFIATLAHELRNPLAPISNAMQFFRLNEPADPQTRGLIQIVERQVRQMTRLVDDLLDMSRITRGKLELRKEPVELAAIIGTAVETTRPVIEAQAHELVVSLPADGITLLADPIRLAQVFANLLNNAAKFTPPGGRIAILAERRAPEVVVSVRDNGRGISAADMPGLFEMFTQVGDSDHSVGLGIGLALSKRLIELHGGTIEASSAGRGRGSEFRVRLPMVETPIVDDQPSRAVENEVPSAQRHRVLVVDDNRDSVESLSLLLTTLGCEVRKAYDGREAVEAAGAFRPEIVFLDIGMPVVGGYEAARRIRGQAWGTEMLLVALTGWGQEEDRRRSSEAGFEFHLTKPVDLATVRDLLRRVRTAARA